MAGIAEDILLRIRTIVTGQSDIAGLSQGIAGLSVALTGLNAGLQIADRLGQTIKRMGDAAGDYARQAQAAEQSAKQWELVLARFAIHTGKAEESIQSLSERTGVNEMALKGMAAQYIKMGGTLEDFEKGALAAASSWNDLSVKTLTLEESMSNVTLGIAQGRSELMETSGIVVNASQAWDKWAEANNRSVKSMTDAEKAHAYALAVYKEEEIGISTLADRQTDLTRAETAAANAKKQIGIAIGEIVLPYYTQYVQLGAKVTQTTLDMVKAFRAGTDPLDALALRFPQLASGIVAVRPVIEAVKRAFADMGAATLPLAERLAPVFERAASAIRPMLERLGVVMRDLGSIAQEAFHRVIIPVIEAVAPVAARVIERAAPLIASLGEGFRDVARMVVTAWENVLLPVIQALAPVVTRAVDAAANTLASVIQAVRNVVQALTAIFNGDWSKAWELLKNAVGQGVLAVQEALKGIITALGDVITGIGKKLDEKADELWTKFLKFGTDLGEKIRQGIIKGLGNVRDIIIGALANKVDDAVLDETWATATPEGKKRLRQNFPDYVPPEERGGGSVPPLKTPVGSADVYGPQTPFDAVFKIILQKEGGFQNDPGDPGNYANGKLVGTKYGISARSYPDLDIKNLTEKQAREIYYRDYWKKSGAESITDPALALVHMDTAINSGTQRAAQFLKMSGGDWEKYLDQRFAWMKTLDDWDKFGVGWTNRIAAIRAQARSLTGAGVNTAGQGYIVEAVKPGEFDPKIKVKQSVVADEWSAAFITSLKDVFVNDPKVDSDCAIIAARIMGRLGVQLEGAANERINAGKLVEQVRASGAQQILNTQELKPGDYVDFSGGKFGAKSGHHAGVVVGVRPDRTVMVVNNPGGTKTENVPTVVQSLDSILKSGGPGGRATFYRPKESPYAQGQSGQATAQDTADQAKATDQLIGKLNEAREAYGKNKLTLEQYRKVLSEVNAEAQKGFNASKGTERKAYENIARVAKEALAAVAPKAGADLSAETIRRAMELTAALEKAQAARDKDPKNTGLVQAYAKAKGELDAFRKSSADAALALDSIGKSSAKTSGQVIATAAQLKKEGGQALTLYKALEEAEKSGNATRKADAQRAVELWIGESKVRKSVYDLEVQAYQTRLKNREADTQHHQRAAAAYQSVQSAVRAGDVKRAQASLDDLKSDQQTRLAVEGKTAADRERIARETNGRILSATYLLNAKIKEQADAEAQAWRKGAEAKALGTKAADAELARRLAENREAEKRANLQAQRDQAAVLRDFGKARADEERQLAAELTDLKIGSAKETATRLKLIEDAELEAFKGTEEEKLALVRRYSQAQYDRAVAIAEATRRQTVREAAGKPNEAAIVEAARQTYLTAVEAARQTRLGAVRAAEADVRQAAQKSYEEIRQGILSNIQNHSDEGLLKLYTEAQARKDQVLLKAVYDEWERRQSEQEKAQAAAYQLQADANSKLASDAQALAQEYAGMGDDEGALRVLEEALSDVMDASERGEDAADAINKLVDAINKLTGDAALTDEFNSFVASLSGTIDEQIGLVVDHIESVTDPKMLTKLRGFLAQLRQQLPQYADPYGAGYTPGPDGFKPKEPSADFEAIARAQELQTLLEEEVDPAALQGLIADIQEFLTKGAGQGLSDGIKKGLNDAVADAENYIGIQTKVEQGVYNGVIDGHDRAGKTIAQQGDAPQSEYNNALARIFELGAVGLADESERNGLIAMLRKARDESRLTEDELKRLLGLIEGLQNPPAADTPADPITLSGWKKYLDELGQGFQNGTVTADDYRAELGSVAAEMNRLAGEADRAGNWQLAESFRAAAKEAEHLKFMMSDLAKGIKKFNEYAQYVEVLAGAFGNLATAVDPKGDLGANLTGLGNLAGKVVQGVQGVMQGFAQGGVVGAAVAGVAWLANTVADALSGFQKAKQAAEDARKSFQEGFKIIDASTFSSFGTRSRGFLADLFGGGPEVVKNINQMAANIAQTLESGVSGAFSSGIKKFLNGEGDMLSALRDGIKGAVIDAVTQAVIQGAVIKGALGQMLTDVTLAADAQNWGRVGEITGQIGAALPGIVTNLQTALGPLVGTLNAALGSNTAAVNGNTQALKEAQFQSTTIIQQGSAGTGGRLARRLAGAI